MNDPVITIGVPTWNRAAQLMRAVESVAGQIEAEGLPAEVLISDNGSDDGTAAVTQDLAARFACVRVHRQPANLGAWENYRTLVAMAAGDHLWLLGDDDLILPGAVRAALDAIDNHPSVFYHCMVNYRAGSEPRIILGSGLDLLNRFGWMNVQGFMSTCLARTDAWRAGFGSENWPLYEASAFAHSCALLEQTLGRQIVIIDRPMVATQDARQTPETLARWAAGGTLERYVLVADALARLSAQGRLPPVETAFLRYDRVFLWTKIVNDLIYFQLHEGRAEPAADPAGWERLMWLTLLLRDQAVAGAVRFQLLAVRQALAQERRVMQEHNRAFDGIGRAFGLLRDAAPAALKQAA